MHSAWIKRERVMNVKEYTVAKKEKIGTISGRELVMKRSGKLSRHEGIVKSGTGYHKSQKHYNRKSKANQQLKKEFKDYSSKAAFSIVTWYQSDVSRKAA